MGRRRDAEREAFWRRMFQDQERSGLSVAEFCRCEDLTLATFYYWRRQMTQRDAASVPSADHSESPQVPTFAQIHVVDEPENADVEVLAPNGLIVRIPEAAGSDHVRRVLEIVSEIAGSPS